MEIVNNLLIYKHVFFEDSPVGRDWLKQTGNIAGISEENLQINYSCQRPFVAERLSYL